MLVSKKIDTFMESLKNVENVKVEAVFDNFEGEQVFDYWYVVIKGETTNIFKIYSKKRMSRIGVYCCKNFRAQEHMLQEIKNCL